MTTPLFSVGEVVLATAIDGSVRNLEVTITSVRFFKNGEPIGDGRIPKKEHDAYIITPDPLPEYPSPYWGEKQLRKNH